jgi:hypothetical protein
MKVDLTITPLPETLAGADTLGSHQFLDEFALRYHLEVAEHLRTSPQSVIKHAQQNLTRWVEDEAFEDGGRQALLEWKEILDSSNIEQLIEIITADTEEGQRLRSSSPFVGTISPEKRLEILNACEQMLDLTERVKLMWRESPHPSLSARSHSMPSPLKSLIVSKDQSNATFCY